MNPDTSNILQRLVAADRAHQRERGGSFLCRNVKFVLGFVILGLALDVFLHLGPDARLALVAALAGGALLLFGWSWYLAWVRRNQLEHIARFLETRDPELGSKLINILQLQEQSRDPSLTPLTRELAQLAVAGYANELASLNLERLARTPQLRREALRAGWAVLVFAVVLGAAFRITSVEVPRFADPFGDHPPYSFTQLEITEPGPSGTNVIYGRSVLVQVQASGHQPKEVFLTAHPFDHPEQETTVPMFDKGSVGFHQQLENIHSDLLVFAHTKDRHAISKKALIHVILVPQLENSFVQITPPAYTGLPAKEEPYSFKNVQALAGSRVRFRLQSNRPLREGAMELVPGNKPPLRVPLTKTGDQEVSGSFEARESGRLRFSLVDADGIPSEAQWEGAFTVMYDLPPDIAVTEPNNDCFVAMDFKVQARIDANDDYGLKMIRIHRALNGVYSPPRIVTFTNLVRQARETVPFDISTLGVQPGDVISLFAEAIDTAPEAHLARSQTINLSIISVEDYNAFLLERSDISDVTGKYEEVIDRLHELVEEQKKLSQDAQKLKADLAPSNSGTNETAARELDALLARQNELNQKLNQHADRMEHLVRAKPLYDAEKDLQEALRRQADAIRQSTATNNAAAHDIAQRSSPAAGPRQVTPALAQDLQRASDEQVARLGGTEQAMQKDVAGPLQDMSRMQELLKDFNQFESLYHTQEALTEQARAYNRAGQLSREDQLALRNLAGTEQQVGELMQGLEKNSAKMLKRQPNSFPRLPRAAPNWPTPSTKPACILWPARPPKRCSRARAKTPTNPPSVCAAKWRSCSANVNPAIAPAATNSINTCASRAT